jgi:hypothetical protein
MTPSTSRRRESPQASGSSDPALLANDEGDEKPVREQLRDTDIHDEAPGVQIRKKRSFEDVEHEQEEAEPDKPGKQARKKSRSSSPQDKMETSDHVEPKTLTNGNSHRRSLTPELPSGPLEQAEEAGFASPKNKRTRDQVLQEEDHSASLTGTIAADTVDKDNKLPGDDRETKRMRDSPETASAETVPAAKVGLIAVDDA